MCKSLNFVLIGLALVFVFSCQQKSNTSEVQGMNKINVFEAGTNDYALYRIPGIVSTSKGTLIAYCEARKTGKSDWDQIDIMMRRSLDKGKSWSPMVNLTANSPRIEKNEAALRKDLGNSVGQTHNNAVMIVDSDGATIHLLYCIEYARCYYSFSTDDGLSFSDPIDITSTFEAFKSEYDWMVLATGPGHGIQLKSGRLLVPVWMSTGTGGHAHRPSCISSIYSDDGGNSWERGEIIAKNPDPLKNPSETVAVELADGRVMFNIRNENEVHRRAIAFSPDGVTNWTTPIFDEELYEPICMGNIIRLSRADVDDKNRILFSNPDSRNMEGSKRQRKNVSLKLSYDEGESWPLSKSIEPGASGYSDLAVDNDKNIYLLYERGGEGDNQSKTQYLTLATFDLNWLTDGKDKL